MRQAERGRPVEGSAGWWWSRVFHQASTSRGPGFYSTGSARYASSSSTASSCTASASAVPWRGASGTEKKELNDAPLLVAAQEERGTALAQAGAGFVQAVAPEN
eukprot:scaffold26625_cov124-Isochrysis_galbana.AAC.1